MNRSLVVFVLSVTASLGVVPFQSNGAEASPSKVDKTTASARIDQLLAEAHAAKGLEPNAAISDETFVRRIYLQIAGRIPTVAETQVFLSTEDPEKRAHLIGDLLHSEAYVSHHYHFWADVLRINEGLGNKAREAETAYRLWLKDVLRENKPYDEMVRELVTATGYVWENGAVGYYQRDRGMPLDNMSNTVRIFLGTRLECAQCHNHPFDKWTQMDYYKMAGFTFGMTAGRYEQGKRAELTRMLKEERQQVFAEAVGMNRFPSITSEKQL